ncbi:MAG: TIGR02301 family protein [Pseudomonadota bacterium]
MLKSTAPILSVKRLALCVLIVSCLAVPASAQNQLDIALGELSEILGALSHLEEVCARTSFARDDMQSLLANDSLSEVRQSILIDAFNRGFRGAATTHHTCTSSSERLIDRHQQRGADIVASLLDG